MHAQVTQKPDGQWRSLFTAGASVASGNTDAKSASLGADLIKLTTIDKWELTGAGQYARSDGATTANHLAAPASTRATSRRTGSASASSTCCMTAPATCRCAPRSGCGLGYHVVKKPDQTFDLSAGLAYTMDRYRHPQVIDGRVRSRYNHAELLLAEESNNKLTDTTTFKQKLTVYPNLQRHRRRAHRVRRRPVGGDDQAARAHGHALAPLRQPARRRAGKNDTLFVTGVSLRFD